MDKKTIIDSLNAIKNVPIAPQKKDLVENSSGTSHRALMQYNAILDNITIGAHTTTVISYAGIDFTFRLLTAEEYINIRIAINKECKTNELFDDFFISYHAMIKVLSKANTPSPFKTEGKAMFTEDDLKLFNFDVLEAIYIQYLDFVQLATQKPVDFTNEEVEAMVTIARKKSEALREFERPKLLTTALYLLNYSKHLETMLKTDTVN